MDNSRKAFLSGARAAAKNTSPLNSNPQLACCNAALTAGEFTAEKTGQDARSFCDGFESFANLYNTV